MKSHFVLYNIWRYIFVLLVACCKVRVCTESTNQYVGTTCHKHFSELNFWKVTQCEKKNFTRN